MNTPGSTASAENKTQTIGDQDDQSKVKKQLINDAIEESRSKLRFARNGQATIRDTMFESKNNANTQRTPNLLIPTI
ncbi:hypothetical protein CCACVL1_24795 [Corchorus capsularis]|uniref:Uncharacterized protein n=1 Tax=Corchorus capsularis TaxID=210143 RepID=A0A1R3GN41_COCAP|nr:hypothetical protein CCACVL1_24795 [Corchorus capsularis]